MPRLTAQGDELERLLPHRDRNLLIDSVEIEDSGLVGRCRLKVEPGDPRGRDIFLRENEAGRPVLMEPALAEYLALSAVCLMADEAAGDRIAFFSAISRFRSLKEAAAGEELRGEVRRRRDKGRFRRFEGEVRDGRGEFLASAEIMAYLEDKASLGPAVATSHHGDTETRRGASLPAAAPMARRPVDAALFGWKSPEMVFIDERVDADPGGKSAAFKYTYPNDHPFCRGHFPEGPVMMGIAQWIAAVDAASLLVLERAGRGPGPGRAVCGADAEILRPSGAPVAEMRGMRLLLGERAGGALPARVLETRRVSFRGTVLPGQTVFVRVKLNEIEEPS